MDFLDTRIPVPVEHDAPELAGLMEEWARRDELRLAYMFDLNNVLSRRDVQRAAASASVVNVTMPGVPGHFTGSPGSGRVAYVPVSSHPLCGSSSLSWCYRRTGRSPGLSSRPMSRPAGRMTSPTASGWRVTAAGSARAPGSATVRAPTGCAGTSTR